MRNAQCAWYVIQKGAQAHQVSLNSIEKAAVTFGHNLLASVAKFKENGPSTHRAGSAGLS